MEDSQHQAVHSVEARGNAAGTANIKALGEEQMIAILWWIGAYKLYFRKRHSWGVALILSVLSWYALMVVIAGVALLGPAIGSW